MKKYQPENFNFNFENITQKITQKIPKEYLNFDLDPLFIPFSDQNNNQKIKIQKNNQNNDQDQKKKYFVKFRKF